MPARALTLAQNSTALRTIKPGVFFFCSAEQAGFVSAPQLGNHGQAYAFCPNTRGVHESDYWQLSRPLPSGRHRLWGWSRGMSSDMGRYLRGNPPYCEGNDERKNSSGTANQWVAGRSFFHAAFHGLQIGAGATSLRIVRRAFPGASWAGAETCSQAVGGPTAPDGIIRSVHLRIRSESDRPSARG